jgi:hypothetical protein
VAPAVPDPANVLTKYAIVSADAPVLEGALGATAQIPAVASHVVGQAVAEPHAPFTHVCCAFPEHLVAPDVHWHRPPLQGRSGAQVLVAPVGKQPFGSAVHVSTVVELRQLTPADEHRGSLLQMHAGELPPPHAWFAGQAVGAP